VAESRICFTLFSIVRARSLSLGKWIPFHQKFLLASHHHVEGANYRRVGVSVVAHVNVAYGISFFLNARDLSNDTREFCTSTSRSAFSFRHTRKRKATAGQMLAAVPCPPFSVAARANLPFANRFPHALTTRLRTTSLYIFGFRAGCPLLTPQTRIAGSSSSPSAYVPFREICHHLNGRRRRS